MQYKSARITLEGVSDEAIANALCCLDNSPLLYITASRHRKEGSRSIEVYRKNQLTLLPYLAVTRISRPVGFFEVIKRGGPAWEPTDSYLIEFDETVINTSSVENLPSMAEEVREIYAQIEKSKASNPFLQDPVYL